MGLVIYRMVAILIVILGMVLTFGFRPPVIRSRSYFFNFFTEQSNALCGATWVALLIRPSLPPLITGITAMAILLTFLIYNLLLGPRSLYMAKRGGRAEHGGASGREAAGGGAGRRDQKRDGAGALTAREKFPVARMISNNIMHRITPAMMIADFLFMSPNRPLPAYAPWIWAAYPLAYMTFIFMRASLTHRWITPDSGSAYPYFFMDPGLELRDGRRQGRGAVLRNCVMIFLMYMAAGYGMRALYLAL